jgi:predicted naringenin-chalcone synthase
LAEIISIGTAVPAYRHQQDDILHFMQQAHQLDEADKRKLAFLYRHSGIQTRYSVLPDYSLPEEEWTITQTTAVSANGTLLSVDKRMALYKQEALPLSLRAIEQCMKGMMDVTAVTHLVTVSCTGMSAPGLDLEIIEALQLDSSIFRTSVNFMGCYAAVHALKLGKMICDTEPQAKVLIVATELCTLHFQQDYTPDNAAAALLFADGSAAVLMANQPAGGRPALSIDGFCANIAFKGKLDMAWGISNKGFLMSLSSYIPHLIREDISGLVQEALDKIRINRHSITHWCIHPGGRKILDEVEQQLQLHPNDLYFSRQVLEQYGNMSSATILFILKDILAALRHHPQPARVFGVAFGPGLTMETFIASVK